MQRSKLAQEALDRQKTLWKPEHSPAAQAWLDAFHKEREGKPLDPQRYVPKPSGLSHRDIHSIINDRSLGARFFEAHSDMLDPAKSVYIDPFYGDLYGQRAIRAWLVPIMSGQGSEASFDPVFPADFLDDGEGGTSVDEWQLVQPIDGKWTRIVRGVSVRRYRDGWIRDAVDFFDTTPIRIGMAMAKASGQQAFDLPEWPRVPTRPWVQTEPTEYSDAARKWLAKGSKAAPDAPTGLSNRDLHDLIFDPPEGTDYYTMFSTLLHKDAVYIDPIFGEVQGRQHIADWLADIMPKTGRIEFERTEKPVFDGNMSYSEWRQVAISPDGKRVVMTRGCSVRRYKDGRVIYSADYFDTAPMMDPEIQAASKAAGSTLTIEDIRKYRPDLPIPPAVPGSGGDVLGLTAPQAVVETETATAEDPGIREKLIQIAMAEVERTGKASISIREVARLAGVSHNTPYFHYAGKQGLLIAVAARSLSNLRDSMAAAAEGARTAEERHERLGVAFVSYALAHPGLFRLMGSEKVNSAVPTQELKDARIAAAQLFGEAVLGLTSRRADLAIDPKVAAVAGWSMMQGLATLLIEGQLEAERLGLRTGEEVVQKVAGFFTSLLAGNSRA